MTTIPQRIFIVGVSGSGKTTLAKRLANKYALPHINMDDIVYPEGENRRVEGEEFIKKFKQLSHEPKWIIEGVFIFGIDDILNRADRIIWIDPPFFITFRRAFIRYFERLFTGKDTYGFWNWIQLLRFIQYFYNPNPEDVADKKNLRVSRPKTIQILNPFLHKVLHIQENNQTLHF